MTNQLLSASSINGTNVYNRSDEKLGRIHDIMIDTRSGKIAYAVLSFGGFLGMGDKYFAIPWQAFTADRAHEHFVLNVPKEKLENAPGFDKNDWPSHATESHLTNVYRHYDYEPFWSRERV